MKHVLVLSFLLLALADLQAQDSILSARKPKKEWNKSAIANRPKDHFLIQAGYNSWSKTPDTVNTTGLPLSFNFYFMFDFPFKTNPQMSVALGAGVGVDNQKFSKTYIDISGQKADKLSFIDVSDTNYFKKYKLTTTYLEAPVELRFSSDPEHNLKSWKAAIGVKVGTLISATTRGKTLVNSNGGTVNAYTMKEKATRYFNKTRLSVTGRIGWGIASIYASYQVNAFIREGSGPDIRPFQIGLTLSGL